MEKSLPDTNLLSGCELHLHILGAFHAEDVLELGKDCFRSINWDEWDYLDAYESAFGIRPNPIKAFAEAINNGQSGFEGFKNLHVYNEEDGGDFARWEAKGKFFASVWTHYRRMGGGDSTGTIFVVAFLQMTIIIFLLALALSLRGWARLLRRKNMVSAIENNFWYSVIGGICLAIISTIYFLPASAFHPPYDLSKQMILGSSQVFILGFDVGFTLVFIFKIIYFLVTNARQTKLV